MSRRWAPALPIAVVFVFFGVTLATGVTNVQANSNQTVYLAEGHTGNGFKEFLTLMNSNPQTTTITIRYFGNGWSPKTSNVSLPLAEQRSTWTRL